MFIEIGDGWTAARYTKDGVEYIELRRYAPGLPSLSKMVPASKLRELLAAKTAA